MDSCSDMFNRLISFSKSIVKLLSIFPDSINSEVIEGITLSKELANFLEEFFKMIPESSRNSLGFSSYTSSTFLIAIILFFRRLNSSNYLIKIFLGILVVQSSDSANKSSFEFLDNAKNLDFWFYIISLDYILFLVINVLEKINYDKFSSNMGSNASILKALELKNLSILLAFLEEKKNLKSPDAPALEGDAPADPEVGTASPSVTPSEVVSPFVTPSYSISDLSIFKLPDNHLELLSSNSNSAFLIMRTVITVKNIVPTDSSSNKRAKRSSLSISSLGFNNNFSLEIIAIIKTSKRASISF